MAKKKKEVVDLKPTNVTEEQLKSIQEVVSQINQYNLEIGKDNKTVEYTYDVNSESTGITNLLKDIKDAGLKLQDLKTEQTTLEKIFVNLVKENNEI